MMYLDPKLLSGLLLGVVAMTASASAASPAPAAEIQSQYESTARPLIERYCLSCHSTTLKKGDLDLERFTSVALMRHDVKPFQQMIEMLESEEMPPKKKPQPTSAERKQLLDWTRNFLDSEAMARAGDPGFVPLRRLSNTEYDCTIRDLTGVDLRPTREFPPDGAAGEGFTNAAEALTDVSPALLAKYLAAAKDVADHAVLLPDGFRFSPSRTRRDWTDESTAHLREFYNAYTGRDGRLEFGPYIAAAVRHREELIAGTLSPNEAAAREGLNPKYFAELYRVLTDRAPSYPLDAIRSRWRSATAKDVPALIDEVAAWQASLWKTTRVGSYMRPEGKGYVENLTRQVANDPAAVESVPLRIALKLGANPAEVVVRLEARELSPGAPGPVVWYRPRFEGAGKPTLLLRDYADFGAAFEIDPRSLFVNTEKYLAAVADGSRQPSADVDALAKERGLDAALLKRWIELVGVPRTPTGGSGFGTPAVALMLLDEPSSGLGSRPVISGWHKKGTDLPVVLANNSDKVEQIPGRVSAHGVAVHPMPQEFVGITWTSPVTADVRVALRVSHAHPACGNGVAWWLEQRRDGRSTALAEGLLDLGQQVTPNSRTLKVRAGDQLLFAVDARDGDHSCDLTEIGITVTDDRQPAQTWDLASDVSRNIVAANPHADTHGNADTWSFVRGESKDRLGSGTPTIPSGSVLGRWRVAAADPARAQEAAQLAARAQTLLAGPRPAKDKDPDQTLHDKLVSVEGPLLKGVNVAQLGKPMPSRAGFGLARERFGGGGVDDASFMAETGGTNEIALPAALLTGREFVVDARLQDAPRDRVVQVRAQLGLPDSGGGRWDGSTPLLASANSAGYAAVLRGCSDFRSVFPLFLCLPNVVPNDEVVSLKMFHREDEPLERLFLSADEQRRLDRLWAEHRFISRQPMAENDYLPLFIGFVTQDQPASMVAYFESQRPAFKRRADEFLKDETAAIPNQLDKLAEFASRAMRRPLDARDRADMQSLYRALRERGAGHDEAFRGVLARVLVSPAFLFRIEHAPSGKQAVAINDWELATRLSYFLWSSAPDEMLRTLADQGTLHEPDVLAAQVRRMIQDPRLRMLAVEFGTQWIHVRGFDEFKEKNESLFPAFDANLRKAMYEESILFFQDLFQADRPVTDLVSADYTFLNETLAKHYGIPDVTGPQWRRVEGVQKYQRGGVLGLGSVQARQAGASRTSPVLRGNWVIETLLGERLPRPPADVPKLPEGEGADGLTMRQQVERHAKDPACAVCHIRIDPFGFALEGFDAVGRLRAISTPTAAPADTHAKLKDGTEFDGIEGLRNYLLTRKKDVVVRLFCRRLLGYALGRSVILSDQPLIDEMVSELAKNQGRVTAAMQVIVRSRQFRMIRGSDYAD